MLLMEGSCGCKDNNSNGKSKIVITIKIILVTMITIAIWKKTWEIINNNYNSKNNSDKSIHNNGNVILYP